jgi:hypothetical protein
MMRGGVLVYELNGDMDEYCPPYWPYSFHIEVELYLLPYAPYSFRNDFES